MSFIKILEKLERELIKTLKDKNDRQRHYNNGITRPKKKTKRPHKYDARINPKNK